MARHDSNEDPYSSSSNNIFEDDMRDPSSSFTTPDKISPFFHDIEDIDPDVRPLVLPHGTWTVLPAIEVCDNAKLPQGPFGPYWHRRAIQDKIELAAERRRLLDEKKWISQKDDSNRSNSIDGQLARLSLLSAGSSVSAQLEEEATTGESEQAENEQEEQLLPFFIHENDKKPIGFLRPSIVDALLHDNETVVTKFKMEPCWKVLSYLRSSSCTTGNDSKCNNNSDSKTDELDQDKIIWGFCINDWLNEEGKESISEHFDRLTRGWHQSGQFHEELKGWRGELYAIYGPELLPGQAGFNPLPGANHVFDMERAACSLFGFATFGVHMTAYVRTKDQQYKIWVPKRSATKQTWPGFLDNSVAGGITTGDSALETIIRECAEEANLPPTFVRKRVRPVGLVSYIYKNDRGYLQPEVEYTYDLEMPPPVEALAGDLSNNASAGDSSKPNQLEPDNTESQSGVTPTEKSFEKPKDKIPDFNEKGEPCILRPCDGEAESFALMSTDEVLEHIIKGKFKPNCALVLIDFFIRHGLITAETDAKYLELSQRLRGSIHPLPGPA